jgi:putative tricarboxylic transport membrane protein
MPGAAPSGARAGRVATPPAPQGGAHELDVDHNSLSPVGPLVLGVGMLGLGLLMLDQTLAIRGEGFDAEGPRFLPLVVVLLWIALVLGYLGQQVRAVLRHARNLPAERFTHLGSAALLAVLLVAYAYALEPLGYLISTVGFFVGAAFGLGSRQPTRDLAVGISLTLVVYLLFTRALGVHLPGGVLPL